MPRRLALILLFVSGTLGSWAETTALAADAESSMVVCTVGTCLPTTDVVMGASITQQASTFFSTLLDTSKWPRRWNCGTWTPFHGWLYIISDLLIWASYFAIPGFLAFFVYKKRVENVPFKMVVVLFIIFILACGLTHLMDAAIFWWPAYQLSALLRFATAAISVFTVFSLIKVIPSVLELKSPAFLELQVKERTRDLVELNTQLHSEINKRKTVSDSLTASNEELLAFSYSVSHDLRTPLRSIYGFSQALKEDYADRLDEEGRDHLTRICAASSRMGELIDDMLKLSKISRNELNVQEVNLSAMVVDIASLQVQRDTTVNAGFAVEKNLTVQADPKMVRIALENLIHNAIKYSSKTKSPIVEFGKVPGKNVFFVKDNGAGFDMQFADKLFGAFQRLHDNEFEGSGIGLATVKRIVLKHGGMIWAEAKVNEGATFFFTLN